MLERSAVRSNAASPAGEDGSSIAWLDEGVERSRPIHKARSSSSWRTVDWRNCGIAKVPLGNSCKHKQPSQRIHYWSQVATDCVCVLTGSGSRRIRCKTAWTSSAVGTALKTQPTLSRIRTPRSHSCAFSQAALGHVALGALVVSRRCCRADVVRCRWRRRW